jgi:hypothetical protein
MTRVQYIKTGDVLMSDKPVLCGTRFMFIFIYPNRMIWEIRDAETNKVVSTDCADTLTKLKSSAKQATRKLGATYYDNIVNKFTLDPPNKKRK